ncbi:hypothetical protein G7066_07395 [Leucobacter coleopterorum]|uniref:Uncharacterized protein n=1 Tax=Leucobacter coleopterorum TaxID=2714933 RepID=A0ABX6JY10_9MICO|nr:hypothetical protein [Leucobacter coleopterorum]QIM18488.1 hypothetical protein G7066_07395 [Leucobacter coleopterorum]
MTGMRIDFACSLTAAEFGVFSTDFGYLIPRFCACEKINEQEGDNVKIQAKDIPRQLDCG